MIYHQHTSPEKLKAQGILNSHLYRAMAKYGIDSFAIEMLEEVPDKELDNKETEWIETLGCRTPNGYNLMSGGGANGKHAEITIKRISQTRQINIDQSRNALLEGLPPYTAYRNNPDKGGEMIRINKHPKCPGKNFLVSKYGTLEATKQAVIHFLKELDSSNTVYSRPKIGGDELAKMPGFCKIKLGYRVNVVRNGRTYDRKFISKHKTDDENKQAAMEYYKNLMAQLEFESESDVQRLDTNGVPSECDPLLDDVIV